MTTKEQFAKMFHDLMQSKCRQVDSQMLETWYRWLGRYDADRLAGAFAELICSKESFPTVGHIIELIDPLPRPTEEAASRWEKIVNTVKKGLEDYKKLPQEWRDVVNEAGGYSAVATGDKYVCDKVGRSFRTRMATILKKQLKERIRGITDGSRACIGDATQ